MEENQTFQVGAQEVLLKSERRAAPSQSARRCKFFYYALVIYIHLLMFP